MDIKLGQKIKFAHHRRDDTVVLEGEVVGFCDTSLEVKSNDVTYLIHRSMLYGWISSQIIRR